jgi:hypothetical protein
MKKLILTVLFAVLINVSAVFAQSASSLNSQSLNGATGLYSIPTGHVGWENRGNFGIDFGYRAIINNDSGVAHIPAVTLTFAKMIEISTAFDIQPNNYYSNSEQNNDDLLFGFKIKLPTSKSTAIAIGTSVQLININNDNNDYNAYQPYVAITYAGNFFSMPANTTVLFGKTLYTGGPENNSNVDFGMGFDLILFPDVFKDAVHWIIDFSNFSYSDNSWPNNSYYHTNSMWRGILNTGFRINMSAIPALSKFKFVIDVVFNDLFDAGARSFTIGAVFGFSP